ncbi:MAG: hypothetical protein ACRCS9_07230 [Hyphomicrobium sp.]
MANGKYQPPVQSTVGQIFDTIFLFALVVASLFVPVYLGLAGGGKTALTFPEKTWAAMGQNETMAAAWEKLGYTPETAHDLIASRFDYGFDAIALLLTAIVIIGYFVFVVRHSDKEYRDVISERFGDK